MNFWLAKKFYQKKIARKNHYNEKILIFPLGIKLKAQTDISENQYQRLDNTFNSNNDDKNANESLIEKEK